LKTKAVDVGSHTIPEEIQKIAKQTAEEFVKAALARASNDDSTVYDSSMDYIE
jgi:protein-disulfide isomerase-like protein with CxxC motif